MATRKLPTAAEAYRSVVRNGDPFEMAPLAPRPLGVGLTYRDSRGDRVIAVDDMVLAHTGRIYAADKALRNALEARGTRAEGLDRASGRVARHFGQSGLILGVSGYATRGFPCYDEAWALREIYACLATIKRLPWLSCDGGSAAGPVGLNRFLANEHSIRTLGVVPRRGLDSMVPHTEVIVYGQTYPDREKLVGLLPDLLVCPGGAQRAWRECAAAIGNGGCALLIIKKDSKDPNSLARTWQILPGRMQAQEEGRLIVCDDPHQLRAAVGRAAETALAFRQAGRPQRLKEIKRQLRKG